MYETNEPVVKVLYQRLPMQPLAIDVYVDVAYNDFLIYQDTDK